MPFDDSSLLFYLSFDDAPATISGQAAIAIDTGKLAESTLETWGGYGALRGSEGSAWNYVSDGSKIGGALLVQSHRDDAGDRRSAVPRTPGRPNT